MKYFFYAIIFYLNTFQPVFSFPISLVGDWYYREGFHFDYQENPNNWIKTNQFPITYKSEKEEGFNFVSFYHEINLTKEELSKKDETLSIFFPYLTNVYKVYWNGEKVAEGGIFEDNKIILNGSVSNFNVKIPDHLIKEGRNELYIHLISDVKEEMSIYGGSNFVIDRITENEKRKSERIELMLLFVYGYVGIYHLLLFIKRPKERYNLFFGGFGLFISIYNYTRSNAIHEYILDPLIVIKIEYPILFLTSAFSLLFFEEFLTKKLTWISKVYLGFVICISVLTLILDRPGTWHVLKVWQKTMLPLILYVIYLMIKAFRSGDKDAKRVVIGFIVLIVTVLADLIGAMRIIPSFINFGLGKYGFMAFVVGIAFVLANKFLRVHNEVEELNANLEQKVIERTEQLQKTLSEVQNLKLQQDGDYFLTSLLIRPLMVNTVKSKYVSIDFYIKQKKTFEFKNKTYEIGGDICIANQINLRGKDYTIFINGDAMGKSIQGAGGALVLGVVFRAVIARTQMNTQNDMLPEMWLKNCFIELQNVFVSFDGSMLISVVMGLIEENTGMMYFINAEHPWCVLYRDGKASFIEHDTVTRKIGILGLDGQLVIKTFHLQVGDIVIIGSDGRDDLLIGYDETGQRIINENEERFLANVEKGKGDLKAITEAVRESGELTDDYTLLRIGYKLSDVQEEKVIPNIYYELVAKAQEALNLNRIEDFLENAEEAIKLNSNNKELLSELIKLYYNKKEYFKSFYYIEIFLSQYPEENEYIYMGSYSAKKIGKTKYGIELGEALRLRDPSNIKNLLNLSDLYYIADNYTRATKIAKEALNYDPNNKEALEIIEKCKFIET